MSRKLTIVLGVIALALLVAIPAVAITNGDPDGEDHPWVVLLLMEVDGAPAFRCSGTLLSATVLLTAGHCTNNFPGSPYTGMRVFTESDVDNGDNNYPFAGPNSVEAVSFAAHPLYETGPFFLHDVGVVILKKPGVRLDTYGTLPDIGLFDDILATPGAKAQTDFTVVGYGLQNANSGTQTQADRIRFQATVGIINDDEIFSPGSSDSILFTNNAATGGTCFGDSGGPIFLEESTTVAAVTSFGLNGECAGTGGGYRLDIQDAQDFVNSFMSTKGGKP